MLELRRPAEAALKTSLDLDQVVFDGDRDLRRALSADKRFVRILVAHCDESPAISARRELLLEALRLRPEIVPAAFEALAEVRNALGLEAQVEIYCIASKDINAFVVPPEDGVVMIGLTSEALERLDATELRFVIGHELGHLLFDHFRLSSQGIFSDERLAPAHAARLCAWMRYAELSADRVGLLCSDDFEAAVRAFFKLTSGLSGEGHLRHADDCARQLAELEAKQMESTEQDWFSTHPYSPLRVKALDLFSRSETFHRLRGRGGAEARFHSMLGKSGKPLSEEELEKEVTRIMTLMDPSFLRDEGDSRGAAREFLALAGLCVAHADGRYEDNERRVLKKLVGRRGVLADATGLLELSPEAQIERLRQLSRELCLRLSDLRRRKLIEDLVAVALADRRLEKTELEVLAAAAQLLSVPTHFVAEALARVSRPLD